MKKQNIRFVASADNHTAYDRRIAVFGVCRA